MEGKNLICADIVTTGVDSANAWGRGGEALGQCADLMVYRLEKYTGSGVVCLWGGWVFIWLILVFVFLSVSAMWTPLATLLSVKYGWMF